MNEHLRPFIDKLTSGKFLFTMGSLCVFVILSLRGTLPIDKVHEIILVVLYAYFSRPQGSPPTNGGTK